MSATAAQIADELYALAPDEFIAARDKAAKAARDGGNRELADTVKKFRRPSIGAWLVNTVARSDRLDELLDLGAALREAQRTLDGAELRAMSRQRHQVVRGLSELAQELTGKKPTDAAQREFEATLEAALADDAAGEAVRTGRLMRSLTSSGLEPVDLTDAVAAPETPAVRRAAEPKPTKKTAKKTAKTAADKAVIKRRAEFAKAVERAEVSLTVAERELDERETQARQARAAQDDARTRTAELEAELDQARTAQTAAEKDRRDADAALKTATRARDAARRAVETARKRAG